MVETPLHPRARARGGRLIGEAFVSLNVDLSQLNDAFRLVSERVMAAQFSMIGLNLNQPLSSILLSGV